MEHAKSKVPNWDVTTSYWLHSPEDIKKFHEDPEWISRVAVQAMEWVDPEVHVAFGQEVIYLDNGKVLNTVSATD